MIINKDCLEALRELPDNSIDSIVTDPPYGLSFMGKKWDYDVPSVEIWQECLRVLKPGGYLLAFAGTRTQHRMAVRIEDAGFEIRDMIAWVYGSGFPKSLNFGKKLSEWEGWGTALKPALEPITVARKPLEKGLNVAQNCLKWGVGGIAIDGCRVGMEERETWSCGGQNYKVSNAEPWRETKHNIIGRFPANLIHDGSDEVVGLFPTTNKQASGNIKVSAGGKNRQGSWESIGGMLKAGSENIGIRDFGDSGSAARFFYCAKASKSERNRGCEDMETSQKFTAGNYSQSPTCKDCNLTLNGTNDHSKCSGEVYYKEMESKNTKNNHPTVKPIALMEYLVKLVSKEGHTVLDPFMGSGSTGIACKKLNRKFIGIERDEEYCKIAEARINNVDTKVK